MGTIILSPNDIKKAKNKTTHILVLTFLSCIVVSQSSALLSDISCFCGGPSQWLFPELWTKFQSGRLKQATNPGRSADRTSHGHTGLWVSHICWSRPASYPGLSRPLQSSPIPLPLNELSMNSFQTLGLSRPEFSSPGKNTRPTPTEGPL